MFHPYAHTQVHISKHIHTHKHVHTHIDTYTYIHTHAHTCTHTHQAMSLTKVGLRQMEDPASNVAVGGVGHAFISAELCKRPAHIHIDTHTHTHADTHTNII